MATPSSSAVDNSQQERLAFLVEAMDGRRFKMVIKGDLHKLQVEKIRRYLKGNGVPEGLDLVYNGIVLRDDMIGEDFGLIPNAVLKLMPAGSGAMQQHQSQHHHMADGSMGGGAAATASGVGARSGFARSGSQQSRAHVTTSGGFAGGLSPGNGGVGGSANYSTNASSSIAAAKTNVSVEGRLKQLQEQYSDFSQSSHQFHNNGGAPSSSQSPASASQQAALAAANHNHPTTSSTYIDPLQQERQLRMQRMTGGSGGVGGSMAPSEAPSGIQYSSANVSVTSHQYPSSIGGSPAKPPGSSLLQQHQQQRMHAAAAAQAQAAGGGGMSINGGLGAESRVASLELENDKLRREIESLKIDLHRKRQENPPSDDMLFNAKANLLELSKDLGVHLAFDQNLTCVIGNDEKNTILITFDAATERLYLYSTVLTTIPHNEAIRLRLFEALLDGAMLGRDMAGGGVGISTQNNIVMMGTSFSLRNSSQFALRDITPAFLEALQRWRAVAADITGGN